ncbi:CppA N-terminal domain-containing protein [Streptococcus devriesei]|uniref:CppA N-terminal domain-containing protein n=1 Tax=Streptococcus devriesei TaxID=231233 RepID=UPI00041A53BB|nr:CppA N-terminal domain-containing protein [Streptococcus devriesei]
MSLFGQMDFHSPVLRVNDRDKNIDFYQKTLGFKLFSEENALAIFTDWSHAGSRFVIEESPAVRTRMVKGLKKLQKMVIKAANADDIAALLANGAETTKILKGANGYAFEALSPENDLFLLHAEDDLTTLKEVEEADVRPQESFEGLSAYKVEKLILNVPDKSKSQDFYQGLFQNQFPLSVDFVEGQGDDLETAPHIAWDLEILEVRVAPDYDLAALKTYLEEQGQEVYLDKKEKVLVLSDPSRIEIWFRKLS